MTRPPTSAPCSPPHHHRGAQECRSHRTAGRARCKARTHAPRGPVPCCGADLTPGPRRAPDPGADSFVADLLGSVCPAGVLPPHPTRDFHTCALAPTVTPPGDAYLSPACVVCVMLGAGFRVFPIGTLSPQRTRPPCAIADRSRAQYQLCFGVHCVVTATGYTRHSRHFRAAELRAYAAHSDVLGLAPLAPPGCRGHTHHCRTFGRCRDATTGQAHQRGRHHRAGGRSGQPQLHQWQVSSVPSLCFWATFLQTSRGDATRRAAIITFPGFTAVATAPPFDTR